MILNLYLGVSTLFFAFLFTVWTSKNWANIFVKTILLFMSATGLIMTLNSLGFVVKV